MNLLTKNPDQIKDLDDAESDTFLRWIWVIHNYGW